MKVQSKIPVSLLVEQKTGVLAVLSTPPIRATNTEMAGKSRKIGAKNVSRETFASHEKQFGGPPAVGVPTAFFCALSIALYKATIPEADEWA